MASTYPQLPGRIIAQETIRLLGDKSGLPAYSVVEISITPEDRRASLPLFSVKILTAVASGLRKPTGHSELSRAIHFDEVSYMTFCGVSLRLFELYRPLLDKVFFRFEMTCENASHVAMEIEEQEAMYGLA